MRMGAALPLFWVSWVLCGSAFGQTTVPGGWTKLAGGEVILRPFAHAPYPHASRAEGYKDGAGKVYPAAEHYSDSTVGVFVPASFSGGEVINFVVHFHGHRNHVASVVEKYKLPEQLAEARADAVMVFPQGPKDVPDSGYGRMEFDDGALKALLTEVGEFLVSEGKAKGARVGRVIVTAHSGGYRAASWVVGHGGVEVSDCFLFDASYGNLDRFAAWVTGGPGRRLVSFHTKHLDDENKELAKLVRAAGGTVSETDDTGFVKGAVEGRKTIIVSTDLPHDEVPAKRDHFALLLETSGVAAGQGGKR